MEESFLQKLRMVKLRDIGHIFLFLLAIVPAFIYRRQRRHLWLICESGNEAQDNAYWLFVYLRREQPQIDAVYAIRPGAPDFEKVASLGKTVVFGSFLHWIYYLAAEVNISSQKYGKPNAAVCYVLEVIVGCLKNRRVFLQHGVIKDDLPFLHWENAKMALFACAAEPEYEFVRDTFGYPEGVVQHLGLCRFDRLHAAVPDESLVLIIPTWRVYLERMKGSKGQSLFLESDYFRAWNHFLNSPALAELLERYDKHAVFCMHRNMEAFESHIHTNIDRLEIFRWQDADISRLLPEAGTFITDFSSIYMDFAYMKKPILYYQFDLEEYRDGHLPTGYFDYERDGFGPICMDEDTLLRELEEVFRNGCKMPVMYEERTNRFFTLYDDKNCERTYRAIERLAAKPK